MQGDADGLKVFTGRANPQLAQKICDYLQIPLGRGRTTMDEARERLRALGVRIIAGGELLA